MPEFTNGDVLRHKTQHSKIVTYVGMVPHDDKRFVAHAGGTFYLPYLLDDWELKPTRQKRWIAVFPDDYVYPILHRNKNTLVYCVTEEHNSEYVKSAQYIQIEVEV